MSAFRYGPHILGAPFAIPPQTGAIKTFVEVAIQGFDPAVVPPRLHIAIPAYDPATSHPIVAVHAVLAPADFSWPTNAAEALAMPMAKGSIATPGHDAVVVSIVFGGVPAEGIPNCSGRTIIEDES